MSRTWMPLYVADYLADTGHLSTVEHGAYMLLIMHYWQNGGLPHEDRRLARICRMSPDEWAESRDALAELFEEGWRHKRIDAELERASDISSKRKAAAEQRHRKGRANACANAGQVETQSPSPSQSSLRSDGQGVSAAPTPSDRAFEAFCETVQGSPIPAPRKLTADRRRKLDARLREHGEDVWREACQRLVQSPFCRGENDRGWTADLDFLLQPKSLNRLIEGGYDARKPPPRGQPPPQEREPRNAGERALHKLQNGQSDDTASTSTGRLDEGNGRRQIESSRLNVEPSGAPGIFRRVG